jgi:hypothetical protein
VLAAEQGRSASGEGFAAKHLRAKGKKAMEINRADVAELVDARDLKSPGATEITHLSDLTRAGNPHEAGGDPAGLSNTPPPLPLAGWPSKTADVFLPTSINRSKDRCRLLQSPPIFSRNPSLLIQVLAPSISVGGEQQGGWRLPSEGMCQPSW